MGDVKVRKVVRRNLRYSEKGVSVVGDINAVIAANVNEPGSSHVSVSSTRRHDKSDTTTETREEPA